MIPVNDAFTQSYARARTLFLEGAAAAGMAIESHAHPLPGKDGEALAMDVVRDGPLDADKLLIISSACHGVEGYCGSGVQVFALHDDDWRAKAQAAGVAVLYIHALNPYGFSHWRRTTHENVDLNRNFQDFSRPVPVNTGYREIADLLLPEQWPPMPDNTAAVQQYLQTRGEAAWQAAVSGGQYEFEGGMFFGGTEPTWSNRTLRAVLRAHGAQARRIAWIDLHTGLGPNGVGERIHAGGGNPQALARARAWWGGHGATPITSFEDGSSSSAPLTGLMWTAIHDECPQAEYTGIAMEYGTLPILQMLQALRAEHWLHQHPEAPSEQAAQIKADMFEAFYTDTDAWRGQVISQARQSLFQAVDGLNS